MADRVCVGAIVGAHGVRGAIRIKSFTGEPADIGRYGPVENEAGARRFGLRIIGQAKGLVIAKLDGVEDRDAAEALKGTKLFVPRERLPETEPEEFLYADLIGLAAEDPEGGKLGTVKAVFDFGAGEVLEIVGAGGAFMVPFTKAAVPVVDVAGGRMVVSLPAFAAEEEDEDGGGKRED